MDVIMYVCMSVCMYVCRYVACIRLGPGQSGPEVPKLSPPPSPPPRPPLPSSPPPPPLPPSAEEFGSNPGCRGQGFEST